MKTHNAIINKLAYLEGLRGIAALWVLLSHAQILSGLEYVPVLSWGGIAVDLFILLSGFLMAHQVIIKKDHVKGTIEINWLQFIIRRWFRLSPLYYLLLIIAIIYGPDLGAYREKIAIIFPWTKTPAERYTDQSAVNFIYHLSYAFGVSPTYSFRTALPDWSLGLEMQFYAVFPLLISIIFKYPAFLGAIFSIAFLALNLILKDWYELFSMPSFLLIKIHLFIIGMIFAICKEAPVKSKISPAILASMVIIFAEYALLGKNESIARAAVVIIFYYITLGENSTPQPKISATVNLFRNFLSSKPLKILGETSYAVYLTHLLILIPIAGSLATSAWYQNLPSITRFLICASITIIASYPLSWILFKYIETPGINAGKKFHLLMEDIRKKSR